MEFLHLDPPGAQSQAAHAGGLRKSSLAINPWKRIVASTRFIMQDASKVRKRDKENQSARWTVCPCIKCSGNLEFDAANEGETIKCPHCGADTVLFIPQVPVDSPPSEPDSVPEPGPKRAKLVAHEQKKPTYRGGVEERLENTGDVFWALGILGGVGGLLVAIVELLTDQINLVAAPCIAAILAFTQGALIGTLCKAGAEIIRLLKKSNGLKFSGEISQPTDQLDGVVSYTCSACGAPVVPRAQTKCAKCGAEFGP